MRPRLVSVLDGKLGDNPWVCGDTFTIADIALYPWIRGWKWSKVNITQWPRVMSWVDRVRARPGVERGLGYGEPKDEVDQWSAERKASTAKKRRKYCGQPQHPERHPGRLSQTLAVCQV